MQRLIGAHCSTAGGLDKAFDRGLALGCAAIQIFVKNNNQWFGKPLTAEEIKLFAAKQKSSGVFVFAHAGYLINLASPDPANYEKSLASLLDELNRCAALSLPFLVLHPGSHLTQSPEAGMKKVAKSLNQLFQQTKKSPVKVLIETTAGQGTNLGKSFEEIADIVSEIDNQGRIGVCFDTCHSFAAGYDLRDRRSYENTWENFDRLLGLKLLMAIHLNDSKFDLGSRKDRHEHIGKGKLGLDAFRLILNDQTFTGVPLVLETPKDDNQLFDRENLQVLRSLI